MVNKYLKSFIFLKLLLLSVELILEVSPKDVSIFNRLNNENKSFIDTQRANSEFLIKEVV